MAAAIQLRIVNGLASVQDLGRFSNRRSGVPLGGAADNVSHRIANFLLGNPADAATIEIAGGRLSAIVEQSGWFALYGTGGELLLNHQSAGNGRPVFAPEGAQLEVLPNDRGNFAYLATPGGWDVPMVLESRSTCLAAGFGGFLGRALQKHDHLSANSIQATISPAPHWFFPPLSSEQEAPIRVLPGAEWRWWSAAQQDDFFATKFRISRQRDRMGLRLEPSGASRLRLSEARSMISTAIVPGTVQVPPDGCPITLLADAQTTGGYPRIAQVIEADLPRLVQIPAGKQVLFQEVSLGEAMRALHAQRQFLENVRFIIAQHFR